MAVRRACSDRLYQRAIKAGSIFHSSLCYVENVTVPVINTDAGNTPASKTPRKQRATARVAKLLVKDIRHTTMPQPKPIELIHHRGLILCNAKLQGISATTYFFAY